MIKKKRPTLLWEPDLKGLECFVKCLGPDISKTLTVFGGNSKRDNSFDFGPIREELRRLIRAWDESGPNLTELLGNEDVLAAAAADIRGHLFTDAGPRAHLILETQNSVDGSDPVMAASKLFLSFLLNPYNVRLRGPCPRCDKYFLAKNQRKKRIYCSMTCGHGVTAREANKIRRRHERKNIIARANASLLQWAKTRRVKQWKEWVHDNTLISKNLLTRMVKEGEIKLPR
jgi:predicted RNA-binding Zn ribbon-like protein